MSRQISAPKLGEAKGFPLRIHENVAFDLHVYCEALPAQWTRVINRAVREFIDRELDENRGFKERFDRLKAQFLDEERRNRQTAARDKFRVIEPSGGRKRKSHRGSGRDQR